MRRIKADFMYIVMFFIACAYFIINQIYLFYKGKHNPYIFGDGERDFKQVILDVVTIIMLSLSLQHMINLIFVRLFLIILSFCVNILNYLSYIKIKDRKIIRRTIIFDIIVIILFIFSFWSNIKIKL